MKTLRGRSVRIGLATTAILTLSLISLRGEEPAQPRKAEAPAPPAAAPDQAPTAARKAYDPSRRVPSHFGKVGLTEAQREQIYKVRAQHYERIEALRRQLDEEQAKMMADCEGVLTDSQKKLLEEYRHASSRGSALTAKGPAK